MTANASRLQSLLWDTEAAWGDTVTSMAGADKITILDPIDVSSLTHPMLDPGRTTQYLNETTAGIPGPQQASFSFSVYLCGHGSTTVGAITLTALENLMGWVLGAVKSAPPDGTTVNGGASTTTNAVTVASGTFAAGQLYRIGAKGDAGADGQWGVVNTHTATDLLSRVAFAAAPANAAVVYTAANVHTSEAPSGSAITGYRFQIFTANKQFICHGCFPTGISITGLNAGEIPRATVTIGVSWFELSADTFPETTALTTHTPAPVGSGSFNLQVHGTTTRNALSVRSFSLDIQLGVAPLAGPDGNNAYQRIVGARRLPTKITATVVLDALAASTNPTYWAAWLTNSAHHILYSLSTGNGSGMGIYLSRVFYRGNRPTQMESEGLNRTPLNFEASTNSVTTSELTLSALRIGFG